MQRRTWLLGLVLLSWLTAKASATQPIGIYAIIDKVVLEPDEKSPERIQLWGAFTVSKKNARGDQYLEPARGYLYFTLKQGDEDEDRKEWKDLKKLAAAGKVAAFSNRWNQDVTVRKAEEKPKSPDVYTTSIGVSALDPDVEYGPVKKLVAFASPVLPVDGSEVEPGPAKLTLRGSIVGEHKQAKVFFEIEGPKGAREASSGVSPGEKETVWTPKLELDPDAKYTWRVWAADDQWKSASRTYTFKVKGKAKAGK